VTITFEIHNHGRQEAPYGPDVADATIEITHDGPELPEGLFRNYFTRLVANVPEESDDWYRFRWDRVERLGENRWRLRATRPYND